MKDETKQDIKDGAVATGAWLSTHKTVMGILIGIAVAIVLYLVF